MAEKEWYCCDEMKRYIDNNVINADDPYNYGELFVNAIDSVDGDDTWWCIHFKFCPFCGHDYQWRTIKVIEEGGE